VTTTLRPPPAPGPDASRRDARWLVAAAVLVVAVVGSVLAFGVVRPPPLAPLDAPDFDGARVEGGRLVVRDGGTVLWSVAARGSYEVAAGWTSPDGRWVALQDTADRLLLVPADGSRDPVVWAEDLDPFVPIVWRGKELPAG
jgi:hypothetical protein